jgi:hypothetical protein
MVFTFGLYPQNRKKISRAKAQILTSLVKGFVQNGDIREFDLESRLSYNEFMDEFFNSPILTLDQYILANHNDNKAAFARANSVKPQQVTEWKAKGYVVFDNQLYSKRRNLNT